SLRELPAPLRAALGVRELRRALHDRPHVRHRALPVQPLPELDAPADMTPPDGVAPSILASDFARLSEQGAMVIEALADQIHAGGAIVDVHLMVERPERHIADFAKAGADNITVHAESTPHVNYAVQQIRELGCTAGVAVCPSTPLDIFREIDVDVALCMTVNPGWGGQAFIPS